MSVPINNIERAIDRANEVVSLIDNKNGVDAWLWAISDCLTRLLDQHKELLSIEYAYPLIQLIQRYEETKIIISQSLNNALSNILLIFEDKCKFEESELIKNITYSLNTLNILGVHAY